MKALILAVLVMLTGIAGANAQSVQRGLNYLRANCARCHAIDKVSESPLKLAPAFRTLHLKYPVESLQESFAEGIRTGHDNMPEFRLDGDQIGDVIAYLKTLEK